MLTPTKKSATARETIDERVGFGSEPPSAANKEDNRSISTYGQNGERPAKNPKPSFHFLSALAIFFYYRDKLSRIVHGTTEERS